MRELTKSMLSLSWAMSLFGMQQMANWMTAQGSCRAWGKATDAFDRVTQATEEQLGEVFQETFKTGDKIQRAMVDLMFGAFLPQQDNAMGLPRMGMSSMAMPNRGMGMMTDAWRQAAGCSGQSVGGTNSGMQPQPTGWGPMPPSNTPGT